MGEIFESLKENLDADMTEKLLEIQTEIEKKTTEIENLTTKISEMENTINVKQSELVKYESIISKYIKEKAVIDTPNSENDKIDYDKLI